MLWKNSCALAVSWLSVFCGKSHTSGQDDEWYFDKIWIGLRVSGAVERFFLCLFKSRATKLQVDRRLSIGCIWVFWPDSVNLACESHSEPSGEHFRRQQEPALHCAVYRQAIIFLAARGVYLTNRAIEIGNYLMEQTEWKKKSLWISLLRLLCSSDWFLSITPLSL